MEHKKHCELCGKPARMYCESDMASLCWVCDERVHSANFLVAKHSRRLLCHVCYCPTPWAAAGSKLGATVSVCDGCFDGRGEESPAGGNREAVVRTDVDGEEYSVNGDSDGDDDDDDSEEDDEVEDEDDYDDEEEDEEDGENQVVPWSCDSGPPAAASSSSSGEESAAICGGGGGGGPAAKRVWDIAFSHDSDDEVGFDGNSRAFAAIEDTPSSSSFRPLKQPRFGEDNPSLLAGGEFFGRGSRSTSAAIIDSIKRLKRNAMAEGSSAASTVLGICRLSRC